MLHLIWEGIIGLVVGALAKFIMPGKDPGGIWITMLIGVVGSFGATFIGQKLGWYGPDQSAGLIMSTVGAVLILLIYRLFKSKAAV